MNVQVIVPTHNRKEYLKKLLLSLKKQSINTDVLVIVDGSNDGTLDMLKSEFNDVEWIVGDGSWWYTKSINKGFQYALSELSPDLFLTMNDDTIVHKDYIESLLKAYDQVGPNCIIGSVSFTIQKPHKILFSGNTIKNRYLRLKKSYIEEFKKVNPVELDDKIVNSLVLPGRGMLIPKGIVEKLKGFDSTFKQYYSDTDFCLRARKTGANIYVSWNSHVFVNASTTGKGTSYKKNLFGDFLKGFFEATSKTYLPSRSKFLWRHGYKVFWPINMLLFIISAFKNYLLKEKI